MDENQARHTALEMAIREVPAGTTWDSIIGLADKFAAFIINGIAPGPEKAQED